MATEVKLTPSRMAGALVFGTGDGFDWRGLGVLSQIDKSLVSLLDMRGGVLRLQGFEDVGLPAWFAMPLRVGATDVMLLGVVRPCRDATNRPGLAGAAIGLAIRADEDVLPRWRAQQSFALASQLIDGLVQGRGFKARVDFAAWRWPDALNEAARLASPTPAVQVVRGPFRRQTIDPEWAVAVGDPGALFVDVLRTDPSGLGSGLLIEAVSEDERRQRQHFTAEALSARSEDVTRALQSRLRDVQNRASAFDGQQRKIDELTRKLRQRDDDVKRLQSHEAALRAKANTADTYAKQANARIADAREKARADVSKAKRDAKKSPTKEELAERAHALRMLESMSSDQVESARTTARLARTLQRMVLANPGLAGAVIKGDPASTQDAEALSALAPEKKLNAALSFLGRLDEPFADESPLAETERLGKVTPSADDFDKIAPDYVPEAPPPVGDASWEVRRESEEQFTPFDGVGDAGNVQQWPNTTRQPVSESAPPRNWPASPPPNSPSRPASAEFLDHTRGAQTRPAATPHRPSARPQVSKPKAEQWPPPGLVGAIIALVIVLLFVMFVMSFMDEGSVGAEREWEREPRQEQSSLRDRTSSTLECESADGRCLRALDRSLDEVRRVVERMANDNPSALDAATAATAYRRFEDLHEIYDRALEAPDNDSMDEALETIREAVISDEGPGAEFLEALNNKRDALAAEGDPEGEFQSIAGQFAALQERFRRTKQPGSNDAAPSPT